MNKVVTINLNGNAYQLEEGAYDRLRDYLEGAARKLAGNPDRDEITADIEQSIADKCRAALGAYRTVVSLPMIETILSEMGPVEDGSAAAATSGTAGDKAAGAGATGAAEPKPAATSSATESGPTKRLYRLPEGAMFGGVCNGLAAFSGVPVNLIRFGFILTTLFWGFGLIVYLVMLGVVPSARTAAEQAAAFGSPATAAEFVKRAREGYYEGMKNLQDRDARREWKRKFKADMRAWRDQVRAEVRRGARPWSRGWDWASPPPPAPGGWVFWPLFALIQGVLTFAFVAVILSLVFTGAVFGILLPWGMPMWMGIVLAALVYNALVWPFRWRRWAWGYGYHGGGAGFWILLLVFLVWFGRDHYHGNLHDFAHELVNFFRQVADSVRDWWHGK